MIKGYTADDLSSICVEFVDIGVIEAVDSIFLFRMVVSVIDLLLYIDNYRVVVTKEFGNCFIAGKMPNFGIFRGTLGQGHLTFGLGPKLLRHVSGDGSNFFNRLLLCEIHLFLLF